MDISTWEETRKKINDIHCQMSKLASRMQAASENSLGLPEEMFTRHKVEAISYLSLEHRQLLRMIEEL